jgi:hypothetical protein
MGAARSPVRSSHPTSSAQRDNARGQPSNCPIDNRWRRYPALAFVALLATRAALAGVAAAAGSAQELPAVIAGNAGIVVDCDEARAVVFDDIEPSVCLMCVKRTAEPRRAAITAIAARACDADPIFAAGGLSSVLGRLIERTVVAHNLTFIGDACRPSALVGQNELIAKERIAGSS